MAEQDSPTADRHRVFISYRRNDTKAASRLIYEKLRAWLGEANVFFDIDSIPIGEDFEAHLGQQVAECSVFLTIIGERWAAGRDAFSESDFVRIEVCAAMSMGIPVLPIFADGASPPKSSELPEVMHPLLRRNGLPVDTGRDFDSHMAVVRRNLERLSQDYLDRKAREREQELRHEAPAAEPSDVPPPQRRYRILRQIHTDPLSQTYLAESSGSDGFQKRVLICRLSPSLEHSEALTHLFREDVRRAAHLSHANIQSIIDLGVAAETSFCVYELFAFRNVAEVIEWGGRGMDPFIACYIARETCRALEYAHGARYETSPLDLVRGSANIGDIYLTDDGRVVLGGFGLGRVRAEWALHNADASEPSADLPPEIRMGETWDRRSDLFIVGSCLWEMLLGSRYTGDSNLERTATARSPQPVDSLEPIAKAELGAILGRLLAQDRAERFQEARDARRALGELLRHRAAGLGQDDIAALVERIAGAPDTIEADDSDTLIDELLLSVFDTQPEEPAAKPAVPPPLPSRIQTPDAALVAAPSRTGEEPPLGSGQSLTPAVVSNHKPPIPRKRVAVATAGTALVAVALTSFLAHRNAGSVNLIVHAWNRTHEPIVGASISLDGAKKCTQSPCSIVALRSGSHQLQVEAEGYEPSPEWLTLLDVKEQVKDVTLTPKPTGIQVFGEPAGLSLAVDGHDIGQLPQALLDMTPGEHSIKVSGGERFAALERGVTLAPGHIERIGPIKLRVVHGIAAVEAGPNTEAAKVALISEGKSTPIASLPANLFLSTDVANSLYATRTGFEPFEQQIHFEDGHPERTFVISLTPKRVEKTSPGAVKPAVEGPGNPSAPTLPKPADDILPNPYRGGSVDIDLDDDFDRAGAGSELTRVAAMVGICRRPGSATGPGRVLVTFEQTGRVSSVKVQGELSGTPVGECVASQFRAARVRSFGGSSVTIMKAFMIPE